MAAEAASLSIFPAPPPSHAYDRECKRTYVPAAARHIRIRNARHAGDIIFTTRSSREGSPPLPLSRGSSAPGHRQRPISCKLNNAPGRIYVTAVGGGFYAGEDGDLIAGRR